MQPVRFIYKNSGQISLGFVADDLGEIDHRLAAYNKDGSVQTARYDLIAAVNTKAIQEQQSEIEQLKAEIRALRAALKERVLN